MTETQPADQATPTHPTPTETPPQPSPTRGFFDQIRAAGVRRSKDRWVAGVGGGLARRFGVDPLLVRAGIIALLILGVGFLAYLIAWALLPDEDGSILAERAIHDGDGWGIFLIIVIVLGLVGAGPFFAGSDGWWSLSVSVALIAGIWWLVSRHRGNGSDPRSAPDAVPPPGATVPATPSRPQPVWAPATASPSGYEPPHLGTPPRATDQGGSAYRRPKAPRAGLAGLLVVLGAAVVGYGIGQAIGASGSASTELVAMLGATAAAGLATIVLGLLGRRSVLTSIVSIGLAISLLGTWGAATVPEGGGNQTWRPTADSTRSTYELTAGTGTLDLRGLTKPPEQQDITATVNLGELVVYVPEGITTRVISDASLGGVTVQDTGGDSVSPSQGGPAVQTEHLFGDATQADLTVHANVRLGSIRIVTPVFPTDPS